MVKMPYTIAYARQVFEHLAAIERKRHSLIRDTIVEQLTHEPLVETRNRKPLLRDSVVDADWELRFGPDNRFRVFYAVDTDAAEVLVTAIGVKRGNRVFVGGEEIEP